MNKGNIDNQLRAIFLGQFPSRNHCDQVKHGIVITEGGEGMEDHLQQEERSGREIRLCEVQSFPPPEHDSIPTCNAHHLYQSK